MTVKNGTKTSRSRLDQACPPQHSSANSIKIIRSRVNLRVLSFIPSSKKKLWPGKGLNQLTSQLFPMKSALNKKSCPRTRRSVTKSKSLCSSTSLSMCLNFQCLNLTRTLNSRGWMEIQTLASELALETASTLSISQKNRSDSCFTGGTNKISSTKRSSRLFSKLCLRTGRGPKCTFKTTHSGSRSSLREGRSLFGKWGTRAFQQPSRRCCVTSISILKPRWMLKKLSLWMRTTCSSTKLSRYGDRTLKTR